MPSITRNDLNIIPYLDLEKLGNRKVFSLTFYDEGEWHLWYPTPDGLAKMYAIPVESTYFAKCPERENDIFLHFIDFIVQRASWKEIVKPFHGLQEDIYNLSASLKKFKILYEYSQNIGDGVSRLVITEIEYLFSVCRSIYDLLQEIISSLWDKFDFFDPKLKKKPLPKTFRKVVFHKNRLCSEEQIIQRFGMPDSLAKFYIRNQDFFTILRKFRDNILHRGSTFKLIFVTERGFAVKSNLEPFCGFNIWNDEHRLKNDLCSLRPALAYLIHNTLSACEDFSQTIESIIEFPPPLVPEMKYYMRGYFNDELVQNEIVLKDCLWWDN